jgi:hypothetical protein
LTRNGAAFPCQFCRYSTPIFYSPKRQMSNKNSPKFSLLPRGCATRTTSCPASTVKNAALPTKKAQPSQNSPRWSSVRHNGSRPTAQPAGTAHTRSTQRAGVRRGPTPVPPITTLPIAAANGGLFAGNAAGLAQTSTTTTTPYPRRKIPSLASRLRTVLYCQ